MTYADSYLSSTYGLQLSLNLSAFHQQTHILAYHANRSQKYVCRNASKSCSSSHFALNPLKFLHLHHIKLAHSNSIGQCLVNARGQQIYRHDILWYHKVLRSYSVLQRHCSMKHKHSLHDNYCNTNTAPLQILDHCTASNLTDAVMHNIIVWTD
jgi:hypothetical protein